MLESLLSQCRPGWSLPRDFYSADAVYRADIERIWRRGWLFAGHTCQVPKPGDYFTMDIDTDSIIVIRGDNDSIRGLHNVCRHRGSVICSKPEGRVWKLVCPYHQWTYGLDGKLLACRGMQEELDKSQFGLRQVRMRELEGLIYVDLTGDAPEFEEAHRFMDPFLAPQGFRRAKIAKSIDYLVRANWKLVWENNRECFHCNVNHPQYIKANFDHYNVDDTTPQIQAKMSALIRGKEEKWTSAGLAATHTQTGMTRFPDAENNIWFSVNRTPLVEGYMSETMDGKQIAPLMGDYRDGDVGTLRIRTLPNFWNHSSCDHGVSTRLLPVGPQLTHIRVSWLVDEGAIEGKDYELEKLLPFWQLTSEQDWQICENQQRGVNSSAYTPGPYSTYKEYNVNSFVRWYLNMLRRDTYA